MTSLPSEALHVFNRLFELAEAQDWRGWDPYDALSSPMVRTLTFSTKPLRIAWTQLIKRSPFNLRRVLFIPKLQNPKALALFASAALRSQDEHTRAVGERLLDQLLLLRTPKIRGDAWGYPFPWQSRAFYAPPNTPNVIVTAFCGQAFLDGFEVSGREKYLRTAEQACRFIREELNRTVRGDSLCFSYTPMDFSCIHNANLLAAALLCRTSSFTSDTTLKDLGMQAAEFSLAAQQPNGAWPYGEAANQQWVDNFHTGFNLTALKILIETAGAQHLEASLRRGLRFYIDHCFLKDGTPRYYADRTWPIDIHSAAESLEVLSTLSSYDPNLPNMADTLLLWTFANLKDPATGHFYFQKKRYYLNKITYLRWADAWMAKALAAYLFPVKIRNSHVAYATS